MKPQSGPGASLSGERSSPEWDDATVAVTPRELLDAAQSPDWEIRYDAAYTLAGYDEPEAERALLGLLHDEANTAPTEAAVRALVARRDAYGTEVLSKSLATADDDTLDDLLTFVAFATGQTEHVLHALANDALRSKDPLVREGAEELLAYFEGTSA
jgi:HEAT repeat protein